MSGSKSPPSPGFIGWMLAQDMDEVLMFASDYPHHEGTDDPIGRFERAMPEATERQKDRFYRDNYKALFALSCPRGSARRRPLRSSRAWSGQLHVRQLPGPLETGTHGARPRLVSLGLQRLGQAKHGPAVHGVLMQVLLEDRLRLCASLRPVRPPRGIGVWGSTRRAVRRATRPEGPRPAQSEE